nr:hypothetical protein I308_06424 [Cryptococcus tetragattii IND107]
MWTQAGADKDRRTLLHVQKVDSAISILETVHNFPENVFPADRSGEALSGGHTAYNNRTPLRPDSQPQSTIRGLSIHYTRHVSPLFPFREHIWHHGPR